MIALGRGSEANDRECTEASIYTVPWFALIVLVKLNASPTPKRIIGRSLSKGAITLLEGFNAAAAPIDAIPTVWLVVGHKMTTSQSHMYDIGGPILAICCHAVQTFNLCRICLSPVPLDSLCSCRLQLFSSACIEPLPLVRVELAEAGNGTPEGLGRFWDPGCLTSIPCLDSLVTILQVFLGSLRSLVSTERPYFLRGVVAERIVVSEVIFEASWIWAELLVAVKRRSSWENHATNREVSVAKDAK